MDAVKVKMLNVPQKPRFLKSTKRLVRKKPCKSQGAPVRIKWGITLKFNTLELRIQILGFRDFEFDRFFN